MKHYSTPNVFDVHEARRWGVRAEVSLRDGARISQLIGDGFVSDENLFDFEITEELKMLASGYEHLGDAVRRGVIPPALVDDLRAEAENGTKLSPESGVESGFEGGAESGVESEGEQEAGDSHSQ